MLSMLVMAGMCCGVNIGETETTTPVEPSTESARRRRMEIHQCRFVATADVAVAPPLESGRKRQRMEITLPQKVVKNQDHLNNNNNNSELSSDIESKTKVVSEVETVSKRPKFGSTSVCGRRKDMEDALAIHPAFYKSDRESSSELQFYGVYDGHGCSHVATRCRDRMHEIVKDELKNGEDSWKETMEKSFSRMDKEVTNWTNETGSSSFNCRCELETTRCDAVGSTAVVAVVTPDKIVVSNCGDSRAVLCRGGVAVPLSSDHKPDRPDELERIEEAGGRVIYWDGARVLGVLAMSRAIGDNYLKPYVIPEPEVTVTERTGEDECLILASDGLWDVVSNDTACRVARMCLQSRKAQSPRRSPGNNANVSPSGESSDKACSDASILLTKLALARHSSDNVSVVVVDLRRNR